MNQQILNILLVDDDEDDYLITRDLLSDIDDRKFKLEWVSNYDEGFRVINQRRHEVYLIDYRLGAKNGLQLLREAIKAGCTAPLILLTGQGDREVDVEAMQTGAADYLVKVQLDAPLLERSMRYAIRQKQAEEALRISEARYRNVSELLTDYSYAFVVSPDGNLTREWMTTEAFADITGYTPEEIEQNGGWLQLSYVHGEDRGVVEQHWQNLLMGIPAVLEYRIIHKSGEIRWLSEHGYPEKDPTQNRVTHIYGAVQNITEHKQAEQTRGHLEAQLRQAQKMEAIGRLAGGIAHDFNNSLTVVMTCSELLLKRYLDDPIRARKYIEEIRSAGERAAALTRQLLAFSRKQVLQPRPIELNVLITDLEKMLRRLIGEDIDLTTELMPKLGMIKADPGQLEQVIMNLVINARDAMPRGGKLIVRTLNVHLNEDGVRSFIDLTPGRYVVLVVSDTGVGMDKETMAHIFEPFFTTKDKGKGTGLGLATVYGIVQQSGGHVQVYSEPGFGTTFKIYLPYADDMQVTAVARPEFIEIAGGSETILLVEDEESVRNLMESILHEKGYMVLIASNGEEALKISANYPDKIDLLLTDVIMPGMSGHELAKSLAHSRPGMKCLYVSGYTDNVIVHHGVLDANIPVFEKPFTPDDLSRRVREVLTS